MSNTFFLTTINGARTRCIIKGVTIAVVILILCWVASAQSLTAVIEKLQQQYVPTILFDPVNNTSIVSVEGTVVTLRQAGVKANPEWISGYTPNFYVPGGSVGQPNAPAAKGRRAKQLPGLPNTEELPSGTKLFVTGLDANDDTVTFNLQTYADLHPGQPQKHRAAVTIQFQPGFVNPSNIMQILGAINGLFTIAEQATPIWGVYVNPAANSNLLLDPDGSFAIKQGEQIVLGGRYAYHKKITNSNVELVNMQTGDTIMVTLLDGRITDGGGRVWVKQGAANDASSVAQQSPPASTGGGPDIVHAGQTMEEVKALLGPPDKTETANGQLIYIYTGLKVTFVNGKVTGVQ